jgi:RNA polymerase sigma-70 factor (ECF subfamily)
MAPQPDRAEPDDIDLMQLIGGGDRLAFALFCRRHARLCLGVAHHLLRNAADSEEVVQEAFLRVWKNAGRWRPAEARVTTWLSRVVVNLCLDHMRKQIQISDSIEEMGEIVASGPSPESLVGERELAIVVSRAVAALPPRQRAALSLVVFDGLDCAEAAKVMQVTVGTMESLLVRGRRQLRQALVDAAGEKIRAAKALPATPRSRSSAGADTPAAAPGLRA